MEPFGLFNLLKSLLPPVENPAQPSDKKGEKGGTGDENNANGCNGGSDGNGFGNGGFGGGNGAEKASDSPSDKRQQENFADEAQNAFVDFINRHDERKKQIKK